MKSVKKEEGKQVEQLSEVEKAQQVIKQAEQKKLQDCYTELQVILDKYGVVLQVKADIILQPK